MTLEKRNNALNVNRNIVNGQTADIHITTHGSDFYWAICAVMGFATICFLALSLRVHRQNRIFYYITAGITMVASVAYFSMGSNLGWVPIAVEWHRSSPRVHGNYREIFYVRYIGWFITTPLILLDLLLTAGMPWPTILWVILVDWLMIVTRLVGALVRSRYKWGYYAFSCAALLYIIYQLGFEARRHASARGKDVGRVFLMCGTLTIIVWICYPVAWAVCEGGNLIAPDSEAVFYGVLDFLAMPIFGILLLWGHRGIDPSRLGLRIRDYDEDPAVHGGLRGEKRDRLNHPHPNGTNGATDGATEGPTHGEYNVSAAV